MASGRFAYSLLRFVLPRMEVLTYRLLVGYGCYRCCTKNLHRLLLWVFNSQKKTFDMGFSRKTYLGADNTASLGGDLGVSTTTSLILPSSRRHFFFFQQSDQVRCPKGRSYCNMFWQSLLTRFLERRKYSVFSPPTLALLTN